MSSKEKICLHEREKHPPPALQSSPAEDEEEEGQTGQSQTQSQAKASSSSSSEEESESESDAESGERKFSLNEICAASAAHLHFMFYRTQLTADLCPSCRKSQKSRDHK